MAFQDAVATIYKDALSKGLRAYHKHKNSGTSGHVTSLDGLLQHFPAVGHSELGTYEIPLSKITGTYYHSRRKAFSKEFLPLESETSEFAFKWMNLYRAHLEEGIRDPILVYEYLNYYYVVEGNKRVSVLKYVDAYGIYARVTRILPQFDPDNEEIVNYYAFIDFYRTTGLFQVWLTKPRRWLRLTAYIEQYQAEKVQLTGHERANNFYKEVYLPFRKLLHQHGGQTLDMTTAEALLLYIKLYGLGESFNPNQVSQLMPSLIRELSNYGDTEVLEIKTESKEMERATLKHVVGTLIGTKFIKIGFVYARDVGTSGWTYAHDLGRQAIEAQFGDRIQTFTISHVPEDDSAYEAILAFTNDNALDVVFTTSEVYRHATLKCAMVLKDVQFFNCSGNRPYVHMTNYYGRTYEPRFIEGVVAGLTTKTGVVGYTATAPSSEVYAAANAFALGMRMVRPDAKLLVMYTGEWNNPKLTTEMAVDFTRYNADLVSNKTLEVAREVTKSFGVYSMLCKVDLQSGLPTAYLAAPIWRWDSFYSRIVTGLLNGAYERMLQSQRDTEKPHHFWWGMDSGVMDIYVDETKVPHQGLKLIRWLKNGFQNGSFHAFEGPILTPEGEVLVAEGETLTSEALLTMDTWVDGVIEVATNQ